MAKGFGAVAAAASDINERKNSGGDYTKKRWFRLPGDGDKAQVRFLESGDDVYGAWFHVTPPTGNRSFGPSVPCIDQDMETGERVGKDCPGCEKGYKRKFQGVINLIWRNAPVFAVDSDGKIDYSEVTGYEDTVAVWQSGIETFEELQIQDESYGLSSRDFIVRRRGTGLNTKYSINPVDGGEEPLSKNDKALAEDKYDLNEMIVPPDYEIWGTRGQAKSEESDFTPVRESPFAKARR